VITAWVLLVFGLPLACGVLARTRMELARLRAVSIAGAGLLFVATAAPFVSPALRGWALRAPRWLPGTGALLRMDDLSLVLPALAAGLWLFTVVVSPTIVFGADRLRATAQSTFFTLGAFLTEHPLVLVLAWVGSVVSLRGALVTSRSTHRHAAEIYLTTSTVLFSAGAVLLTRGAARGSTLELGALVLVVAGAVIRKGIFPAHAWIPALFEHGRLGPAILFSSPQVGTYVVAVLVVPRAPAELLRVVALLSLLTGVYAAAQAVVQRSARRACAYLFVSQSALVMAGLDCTSREALTGALVLWLSSSISFAGLGRCLLVLEARRGQLDLDRHHGAYERKPLLAGTFLVLGLSYAGFPGTLGFVGEELLLGGAVGAFPWLGFLVVVTSALIGIAVLRMYFSLFTGPSREAAIALKASESSGFVAIAAVLLVTGLAPAPLVASRQHASERLFAERVMIGDPPR
jgi:NADH-quinone oxidoreductase subunit M